MLALFFEFISKICFVCWNYKSVIFGELGFFETTAEFAASFTASSGFNTIPDLGDRTGLNLPGLFFLYSTGYFLVINGTFC